MKELLLVTEELVSAKEEQVNGELIMDNLPATGTKYSQHYKLNETISFSVSDEIVL